MRVLTDHTIPRNLSAWLGRIGASGEIIPNAAPSAPGRKEVYVGCRQAGMWRSESPGALQALAPLQEPDGRVHFAGDYITHLSSFMQGASESARTAAAAIRKRGPSIKTPL